MKEKQRLAMKRLRRTSWRKSRRKMKGKTRRGNRE